MSAKFIYFILLVATYTKLSPVAPTAVMTIPRVNYSVFS